MLLLGTKPLRGRRGFAAIAAGPVTPDAGASSPAVTLTAVATSTATGGVNAIVHLYGRSATDRRPGVRAIITGAQPGASLRVLVSGRSCSALRGDPHAGVKVWSGKADADGNVVLGLFGPIKWPNLSLQTLLARAVAVASTDRSQGDTCGRSSSARRGRCVSASTATDGSFDERAYGPIVRLAGGRGMTATALKPRSGGELNGVAVARERSGRVDLELAFIFQTDNPLTNPSASFSLPPAAAAPPDALCSEARPLRARAGRRPPCGPRPAAARGRSRVPRGRCGWSGIRRATARSRAPSAARAATSMAGSFGIRR